MQNQTEESWLLKTSASDLGTGMLIFPEKFVHNLGRPDWEMRIESHFHGLLVKALKQNIRYLECVKYGIPDQIVAFKWVPNFIADFNSVCQAASSCNAALCVDRCARYGCICVSGECK